MNPNILLPLVTCSVVLLVTGATAIASHGHLLDFDISVTSTSLLPHQPRIPRQTVKEAGIVNARKKMRKQLRKLKKLGCKPKWTKVYVKEYIGGDNAILDKELRPEVVVVKRCIKSCSYCGSSVGIEHQECYPENVRNTTVIIMYTDDVLKYYRVPIPEHKRCKCK